MSRFVDMETGEIVDLTAIRRRHARALTRARLQARRAGKKRAHARPRPAGWGKWWRQLAAHLGTILLFLTLGMAVIIMAK